MKTLKLITTIIIAVCMAITTISCRGEAPEIEKFTGKLSEQVYETLEQAAEAYYDEQIKGGDYEGCEYKGYSFKKELAKNEKHALNLGDISVEDIISAERGKISFTYGSEVFLNTVYIIQTNEGYHYYSLEAKEDEAVCYDYYDYLISRDMLDNVTVKTNAMIIKEEGYSRQTEVVTEYHYSEEGTWYKIIVREFFNGGISESTRQGYILSGEEGFAVYGLNEKGEYVEVTDSFLVFFLEDSKDVYMVNAISNLYARGHNLFKVSDKTFVLRDIEVDNLSRYFEGIYYSENEGVVNNLSYVMSVTGQKITSTSVNIYATNTNETQDAYISIESSFSKYGETEVVIPEEVLALWNERE